MFSRSLVWPLCATLLSVGALRGEEWNGWPFAVQQTSPDGESTSDQYLGPLFFRKNIPDYRQGFRPFYLQAQLGDMKVNTFLYPLFTWREQEGYRSFSFFQLINNRRVEETGQPAVQGFDVWPFYFSKETGDPATTYHALLPVAGTIKQRFGKDRLTWYAFPLYLHSERSGLEVTTAPWPFLRFIDGDGHHGFEFWPLFGRRGRAGDYDRQFYLWPLLYKSARHLSEEQPTVNVGALPFYTRDTGPGYRSETYVWPFFGYTRRTAPYHYDEQRYFWPFLVQGRGDDRFINRWAPIYTHSTIKGYDKTWFAWPIYRHAEWADGGIAQEKNQVLFFLYWSLTQRSLTNPDAAPAHKTHLWPLFSSWNNGAGRRQVQLLSPLEVFFPTNEIVRELYTPLFAVYRYARQDDDTSRHSFLWNAVTYRRSLAEREFHLGPLLSVQTAPEEKRVALGNGLIGWQRRPGQAHGRLFLFDFQRKAVIKTPVPPAP